MINELIATTITDKFIHAFDSIYNGFKEKIEKYNLEKELIHKTRTILKKYDSEELYNKLDKYVTNSNIFESFIISMEKYHESDFLLLDSIDCVATTFYKDYCQENNNIVTLSQSKNIFCELFKTIFTTLNTLEKTEEKVVKYVKRYIEEIDYHLISITEKVDKTHTNTEEILENLRNRVITQGTDAYLCLGEEKILLEIYNACKRDTPDMEKVIKATNFGIAYQEFLSHLKELQDKGMIQGVKIIQGGQGSSPLIGWFEKVRPTQEGINYINTHLLS